MFHSVSRSGRLPIGRITIAAIALAAFVMPLAATSADARGKSRAKSGDMMRLGGPGNGNGNGRMMRLGGPPPRTIDSGIFTLPGRFNSNRPDDIRQYFLRRDQEGSGG